MILLLALLLTVFTGFSGLVYEVTWQKYLATLLGSHSEATAAVLGIFLGGLSVGYALFGRATRFLVSRARRRSEPVRLLLFYALVEGAIGIYAAAFPILFGVTQRLSIAVPVGSAAGGFAFDILLSAILIGPPSVLMGGTIPILTLALTQKIDNATRVHALIYGCNTVGAFAGALAGGFLLIPLLGLDHVLYAMGCINLAAAAGFVVLHRLTVRIDTQEILEVSTAPENAQATRIEGYYGLIAVVALSGFAMMTIQTVLNRVGGLSFGASTFTFAMVVAVFVLSIALGSLAVSAMVSISSRFIVASQWALLILLVVMYHWLPDAPYFAHVIRSLFRDIGQSLYPYHALVLVLMLCVLLIPIGLSGALLPLLFHHLRSSVGELGAIAGRLYAWNTAGSLMGALLGGYVLLFWFDLHSVFRIALAALLIEASILTVQLIRLPSFLLLAVVVLPGLIALWMLSAWDVERLDSGLFRQRDPIAKTFDGADEFFRERKRRIVFHRDGPSTTATVRESKSKDGRLGLAIVTNGKPDGHTIGDYPTMAFAALLPSLLAAKTERSFVIGYGTGVTAGELAALDQMREVHVAEISQAVLDAAPLFEEANLAPLASPKVRIYRGDAYRTLLRGNGLYDVIVSEPSNPWVTGVEMLFSVEFLSAARSRLAPGGVYAQWFHLYENTDEAVALVLRTYAEVFDHVSVWFTMGQDVLLLGFDRPDRALRVKALRRRFLRTDYQAGFARMGIEKFAAFAAHELVPLGVVHSAQLEGEIHTLRHPILSDMAARGFFIGEQAELPRFVRPQSVELAVRNSLLRRIAPGRPLSEEVLAVAAREVCRRSQPTTCLTLLARWKRSFPRSERLANALAQMSRELPDVSPLLTKQTLSKLMGFFGGPRPDTVASRPLVRAGRETARYLEYFHLPIPFDRRVLFDIWRGCDTPRCEKPFRELQRQVGPLEISD